MKVYSVPLLLILWAIAAVFGYDFDGIGVAVLLICAGVNLYELAGRYRDE